MSSKRYKIAHPEHIFTCAQGYKIYHSEFYSEKIKYKIFYEKTILKYLQENNIQEDVCIICNNTDLKYIALNISKIVFSYHKKRMQSSQNIVDTDNNSDIDNISFHTHVITSYENDIFEIVDIKTKNIQRKETFDIPPLMSSFYSGLFDMKEENLNILITAFDITKTCNIYYDIGIFFSGHSQEVLNFVWDKVEQINDTDIKLENNVSSCIYAICLACCCFGYFENIKYSISFDSGVLRNFSKFMLLSQIENITLIPEMSPCIISDMLISQIQILPISYQTVCYELERLMKKGYLHEVSDIEEYFENNKIPESILLSHISQALSLEDRHTISSIVKRNMYYYIQTMDFNRFMNSSYCSLLFTIISKHDNIFFKEMMIQKLSKYEDKLEELFQQKSFRKSEVSLILSYFPNVSKNNLIMYHLKYFDIDDETKPPSGIDKDKKEYFYRHFSFMDKTTLCKWLEYLKYTELSIIDETILCQLIFKESFCILLHIALKYEFVKLQNCLNGFATKVII